MHLKALFAISATLFALTTAASVQDEVYKGTVGAASDATPAVASGGVGYKEKPANLIRRFPVDDNKADTKVVVPEKEPVDARTLKRAFLMKILKTKRSLDPQAMVFGTEMGYNGLNSNIQNYGNHRLQALNRELKSHNQASGGGYPPHVSHSREGSKAHGEPNRANTSPSSGQSDSAAQPDQPAQVNQPTQGTQTGQPEVPTAPGQATESEPDASTEDPAKTYENPQDFEVPEGGGQNLDESPDIE